MFIKGEELRREGEGKIGSAVKEGKIEHHVSSRNLNLVFINSCRVDG